MLKKVDFIKKIHHETTRKSSGGGGCGIFFLTFSNHKDFNTKIHQETMRKSCGGVGLGIISPRDHKIQQIFSNALGKFIVYMILLRKFTMRP